MVSSIYKKTFSVLMKRPFRLWGISLLAEFLCLVAYAGFIGVPAAAFCAALLLSASMSMIFLNSYRTGLEPKTSYLFASFKKDRILRVLGGMAWMQLWIFLWSLIPIVGIVFGIIRMYEYRFVPYILMTREDVRATDAVKLSKQETLGYKGEMYGADILLAAVYWVLTLALYLLTLIPHSNAWLSVLVVLLNLIMLLFRGVLQAAVYDEIQKRRTASAPQPSSPVPPTRPAQPEWPVPSEWPDAPTQPIQYDVPAQPEPAEPVTQPAPQGKPVVFSLEPELPARPQRTNRYCPHCGAPVKLSDAVFCTVCGKSLS